MNIEEFNPKKADLVALAERYKSLTINGPEDKAGYEIVNAARKDLKAQRVLITKTGKALRDDANKFAKEVIAREKELVAIVEPLEEELEKKILRVDNMLLLDYRRDTLKALGGEFTDDQLLDMTEKEFKAEFQAAKQKVEHEQELKRLEEEQKAREAEQAENQKRLIAEAEERAKKEAEERFEREKAEAKERDERERIEAIERKEREEREAKEREERLAQEAKEREEKEAEAIRKNKKYNDWLSEHAYSEATDKIVKEGNTFYLYRKVSEITL